ncbi:hypothetical protein [Rosenbergiella epipactidis]|uniref:hypothetical protein n=1 Tax=Rosenbergiella epipactidis TaxID=1544694 RepID=UPI001F4D4468|nr:hypothetical protein [Rosenbergiella epipactidis]
MVRLLLLMKWQTTFIQVKHNRPSKAMTEKPNLLDIVALPSEGELPTPDPSAIEEPPKNDSGAIRREEKDVPKELLLLNEDVEDRKADRALREKFGDKAYKVVRKTLYGWAWLLGICGFFGVFGVRVFTDSVMIAITTAVTLNVFAAFLGVIRGLFPSGKEQKKDKTEK